MADMARRELLTDDERGRLFGIPVAEAELIRHYTLSPAEFDLAADRRGSGNRLGFAVQLCLLRYPGFGLRADEAVPAALLTYLAQQLGLPAAVFLDYSRRVQTRLDHAGEISSYLRFASLRPRGFASRPQSRRLCRMVHRKGGADRTRDCGWSA